MSDDHWTQAALEFFEVMRRKTAEENAQRGLVPCPHDFKSASVCPICVMHARLRAQEEAEI